MPIRSLGKIADFNKIADFKKEESKKMKVMCIGESMNMPSGFGGQMKILAEGLANKGHEVVVLTSNNLKSDRTNPQEWTLANIKDVDAVDRVIHRYAPDVLVVFWYLHMVTFMTQLRAAPANCPIYFWLPWEGSTPPTQWDIAFRRVPRNHVIHLSRFARDLWSKHVDSDVVIPHAYHPDFDIGDVFKDKLRRKWSQKLRFPLFDDSIVIINADRNIKHKRWDATFDFISKISKKFDKSVQLIAHTKLKDESLKGSEFEAFDLIPLSKLYGVEDQVVFTGFDWVKGFTRQELAELYALSDLRISTSEGEGFGCGGCECAIVGCPQVVNNSTTAEEIFGEGCDFLVESSMRELHWNALFQVPNVDDMVERACNLIENPENTKLVTRNVQERVRSLFSSEVVIDKWESILKQEHKFDYSSRWGYQSYFSNKVAFRDLALVVSKVKSHIKVFELGAYDGLFADFAISTGIVYSGLEWEKEAIDLATPLSQLYISHKDLKSDWMNADAIVLTDILERLYEFGETIVFEMLERACQYDWLFLRPVPFYKWNVDLFDRDVAEKYLVSKEMSRRHDLEVMVTSFAPNLEHEIWQKGKDTSFIPTDIATASKK